MGVIGAEIGRLSWGLSSIQFSHVHQFGRFSVVVDVVGKFSNRDMGYIGPMVNKEGRSRMGDDGEVRDSS